MTKENDPTHDVPAPLSDMRIDDLLREAETLTEEVAKETGVSDSGPTSAVAVDDADAGDAESAVESVQNDVLSIQDLLGDDDIDELIVEAESSNATAIAGTPSEAQPANAPAPDAAEPAIGEKAAPTAGAPRVEHAGHDGEPGDVGPSDFAGPMAEPTGEAIAGGADAAMPDPGEPRVEHRPAEGAQEGGDVCASAAAQVSMPPLAAPKTASSDSTRSSSAASADADVQDKSSSSDSNATGASAAANATQTATDATPSADTASAVDGDAEDAGQAAAAPPIRRRAMQVAGAAIRLVRRMLPVLLFKPPNMILGVFVLLDRPFSGLSQVAKHRIGLVAVVTVIMGALSFLLPILFGGNPYTDIPAYAE